MREQKHIPYGYMGVKNLYRDLIDFEKQVVRHP